MIKQYIVDAFTDEVFHGNQAAICVLEKWLPEELMMDITRENNFSETAFIVKEGEKYHLRWFTPGGEIDLCGHATLASAFVMFNFYVPEAKSVTFTTLSGDLIVNRLGDAFEMEFPAYDLNEVPVTEAMTETIGVKPVAAFMGRDLLCIVEDEADVVNMENDQAKIEALDGLLLHVSARGKDADCVSRSFGPKLAISEDPVCGSGHCHIVPYWVKVLGKNELTAYQASKRGGTLYCRQEGNKIFLAGKAVLFSQCELNV